MDFNTSTLTPLGVAYLKHDPLSNGGDTSGAAARTAAEAARAAARGLLWAPAGAGAGLATPSSTPSSSSPSTTGRRLSDSGAGAPWSERCEACIRILGRGQALEALPATQRHVCSMRCGFWA